MVPRGLVYRNAVAELGRRLQEWAAYSDANNTARVCMAAHTAAAVAQSHYGHDHDCFSTIVIVYNGYLRELQRRQQT